MNLKNIDDEATARKLLNCIAVACGFKSAWLSWGSGLLNYIKFEREDEYVIHDVANIVTFPVKASTCVKAVKELLNKLDKQGQILLKDYSFDECPIPICWLKKEDVFSNDILKFEAALIGVELND